ncbi:MAG TPA: nucleotide disphospho-sugar-binding domain-containing protein [Longimicrobiaceae bacterium]|nr:nucleotide disphospho-sugar-binding domain-containing protein [Longimicrobiaceae bacterium]
MRFLFCAFATPGYLFPLAGLALELRRRGHAVAFATGPAGRGLLAAAGLERVPRGEPDGDSFRLGEWETAVSTAIDLKHVEYAAERFRADALVTHVLCQAPLLARERRGLPVAVLGHFGYLWPRPGAAPAADRDAALRAWRLRDGVRILNQARALFRLPPLEPDPAEVPLLGDLHLLRSAAGLEPDLAGLPARVHAVGACLWEPPRDEGRAWAELRAELAAPDAPLLYAQQGRTFGGPGFWPRLAEAVAGRPLQVVASLGRMDAAVGALPANVLARPHVAQGLVLPHARAVLSGGHTTVVAAALAHGLPGVVVPGGGETPENAATLARLGCARRLEAEGLTAEALRRALEEALEDPGMRRAARRAQRALAAVDSFPAAAELVERMAAGRAPVLREEPAEAAGAAD